MSTVDVGKKIAEWKAKPVALTRKEKIANRETVRQKAALREDKLFAEADKLLASPKTPANTKARIVDLMFDRIAGKAAKPNEEQRPETELDRMSHGQTIAYLCEEISRLDASSRRIIADAIVAAERNISIDTDQLARRLDEEVAEMARMEKPKREVKIPRR